MPDAPDIRGATAAVTLLNGRNQPVELHLPSGVRVLLPGACTTLDAAQLALPQVAWLVAHKALVIHAAADPPPAQAASHEKTSTPRNNAGAVKESSRAPSGANRLAAGPASTKRASKGEKA